MNGLYDGLIYIRSLLLKMQSLNEEEAKVVQQMQRPLIAQRPLHKVKKEKSKIIILIVVYLLIIITQTFDLSFTLYEDQKRALEYDMVDDKAYWVMTHDEPYPGYDGELTTNYGTALVKAMVAMLPIAIILAIIVIVIARKINKKENKRIEEFNLANAAIEKDNQRIAEENKGIILYKEECKVQIEEIRKQKCEIANEYRKNALTWFPKDYGYLSAVNYFINLVENHMVTNIQDAVEKYLTYMYRAEVTGELKAIKANQTIMINNQRIMISQQEELVRQQILGNMINSANLAVNISNNAKLTNIQSSAASTASSMAQMNSKLR
ncbi:MAG: hypothetical protein J6L69_10110 [Lachnospiraceae bacterium]|nr:hypothetical protein [Lachnospiraceae bacterium]